MQCQRCGFENPETNRFCGQCGHEITTAGAPAVSKSTIDHLPKQISDKIIATKPQIEGEHKAITVLFTDVVNYTSIVEKLDPEELQESVNAYFKMLIEVVYQYEGIVDQLLGDGMLVLFGAPLAHEDHAQRACYCALAIQRAIQKYAEKMQQQYGIDFKMRVGINSGTVIVGSIGNDLHMEYLAVGNTVNLAARMETVANPGGILVSSNTHTLVKDYFNFETVGEIVVKGKEQSIFGYQLVAAKQTESRFDAAVMKGLSRFFGREVELTSLRKAVLAVEKGSSRVIDIMGEPGIGKSRLLREFRENLTPDEYSILEGRCLHYGNTMPYRPIIDILRSYFDIEEGKAEPDIKEQIFSKVKKLGENFVNDLPSIYEILSLKIEDNKYLNIEAENRRNKLFDTVARLLAKESTEKPLIITVEDLHWIDNSSEELLMYLIQKLENCHVLFLLVYRPEYTPPWKNQTGYLQIHLSQLSPRNSVELLTSLLAGGETTPELKTMILAKAEGNPLFIEEYTFTLIENELIRKEGETYSLNTLAFNAKPPETLQGIIAARIDRLAEGHKNILQVASVIGLDFSYTILESVGQIDQGAANYLDDLRDLEFVVKTDDPTGIGYAFKHALIREVAYSSLLSKRRKELHENIANTIENLFPERIEDFWGDLAYHFSNSESLDKALDYSIKAGNKAQQLFANQEALQYYQQALELCAKLDWVGDGIAAKLHENLGDIYHLISKHDQALESYETSFRLYEKYGKTANNMIRKPTTISQRLVNYLTPEVDQERLLAALYHRRNEVCRAKNQFEDGLKWVEEGLSLPGITDMEKAQFLADKAWMLVQMGRFTSAIEWSQRALRYAGRFPDASFEARAYDTIGWSYIYLADAKLSIDWFKQALDIFTRLQKPEGQAHTLNSLGVGCAYSGEWETAKDYFKKSMNIAEKIGSIRYASAASCNLADLLIRQGHVEESIPQLTKALDLMAASSNKYLLPSIYVSLSQAYCQLGNWLKANDYARKSLSELDNVVAPQTFAEVYLIIAEVHLGLGELDTALQYCSKSLEIITEIKYGNLQGRVYRIMGTIYHNMGQWDKAEEKLQESFKFLEKTDIHDEKAHTLWSLAVLYFEMEKASIRDVPKQTIQDSVQKAVEIYNGLGISYDEALADKLLKL